MRVISERPPMFDEIDARFRIAGKPIIFAWGDVIYNPAGIAIPPHLMAHEEFHGWRQTQWTSIEQWWKDYIDNDAFRLEEEILAHQVEYRTLLRVSSNRRARRGYLKQTAKRLAAPLYGRMITLAKARKVLLEAAAI